METILTIVAVGTLNAVCFFIGAKIGQKVQKGEPIQAPNLNPMDYVQKQRERHEADKNKKRLDTILHNVNTYDGTSAGQKELPR